MRERERERERICCSTYFSIYWLLLVCALMKVEPTTLVYWEDDLTNGATQLGSPFSSFDRRGLVSKSVSSPLSDSAFKFSFFTKV